MINLLALIGIFCMLLLVFIVGVIIGCYISVKYIGDRAVKKLTPSKALEFLETLKDLTK